MTTKQVDAMDVAHALASDLSFGSGTAAAGYPMVAEHQERSGIRLIRRAENLEARLAGRYQKASPEV